jgi:hypothetical protein
MHKLITLPIFLLLISLGSAFLQFLFTEHAKITQAQLRDIVNFNSSPLIMNTLKNIRYLHMCQFLISL